MKAVHDDPTSAFNQPEYKANQNSPATKQKKAAYMKAAHDDPTSAFNQPEYIAKQRAAQASPATKQKQRDAKKRKTLEPEPDPPLLRPPCVEVDFSAEEFEETMAAAVSVPVDYIEDGHDVYLGRVYVNILHVYIYAYGAPTIIYTCM